MKRFTFSLQTIHNVRAAQREKEEQELSRLQTAANALTAQLQQLTAERQRLAETYASRLRQGVIDPVEAGLNTSYLGALLQRERELQTQLAQAESRVTHQRQRLIAAERDFEVTARLRAQQRERHQFEANRAEQTALDEMATLSNARRLHNQR